MSILADEDLYSNNLAIIDIAMTSGSLPSMLRIPIGHSILSIEFSSWPISISLFLNRIFFVFEPINPMNVKSFFFNIQSHIDKSN